jgi:teichuronic acid biosynthesis glycosyltransferase TuaH
MTAHQPRSDPDSNPGTAGQQTEGLPDVVLTLMGTWQTAVLRGFSFSDDRLAATLLGGKRARRVLICDSFRNGPRKLAAALRGRTGAAFPESSLAAHHAPIRLGRAAPLSLKGIQRAYASYERGIRRAAARRGLEQPFVITANPFVAGFCDFSWAGPVTYYAWDDPESYEPFRKWWPLYAEAFECLREKRRRVVMVGEEGIRRIRPTGPYAVVPNGIDPAEWQHLPPPPGWYANQPQPRLLYLGSLESRVDTHQLRCLATAFPTGSIALVGALTDPAHFATLRDVPNITFHPAVSRRDIPGLIAHADVGLVPHRSTRFTECVSRPLKVYEYLAAGRPVAAVATHPGLAGLSERVTMIEPGGDMVAAVQRALAVGPQPEPDRLKFVAEHSWEERFDALVSVAFAQ